MPALFSPCDQPDYSDKPKSVEISDLILQRDMNQTNANNVVRVLEGIRAKDREFNGAVLRFAIASARNMAEAYLASLDAVEAECRAHLAERERVLVFSVLPPARRPVPGTKTGYPATMSPAGVE